MTDTTELAIQRRHRDTDPLAGLEGFLPPLARASDPATSHDAAEDARPRLKGQRGRIIAAYRAYGPMTAEQVGRVVGFDAWRRVSDLRRAGVLVPTGQTQQNASGSDADVLTLARP